MKRIYLLHNIVTKTPYFWHIVRCAEDYEMDSDGDVVAMSCQDTNNVLYL